MSIESKQPNEQKDIAITVLVMMGLVALFIVSLDWRVPLIGRIAMGAIPIGCFLAAAIRGVKLTKAHEEKVGTRKPDMLNELQSDLRELIDLVRAAENYDTTMIAAALAGTPIPAGVDAAAERERKGQRIEQLRGKWDI